jgi:hypothetical protein
VLAITASVRLLRAEATRSRAAVGSGARADDRVLAARGRQTVATALVIVVMSLSSSMLDVRPG